MPIAMTDYRTTTARRPDCVGMASYTAARLAAHVFVIACVVTGVFYFVDPESFDKVVRAAAHEYLWGGYSRSKNAVWRVVFPRIGFLSKATLLPAIWLGVAVVRALPGAVARPRVLQVWERATCVALVFANPGLWVIARALFPRGLAAFQVLAGVVVVAVLVSAVVGGLSFRRMKQVGPKPFARAVGGDAGVATSLPVTAWGRDVARRRRWVMAAIITEVLVVGVIAGLLAALATG